MPDLHQTQSQLERFEQFLATDPGNVQLLAQVAELRLKVGNFDGAKAAVQLALTNEPQNATLQSLQATIAMAAGDTDLAIEKLQGLVGQGFEAAAIRYNLGYALLLARRPEEARDILKAIVDLPDAYKGTSILLARAMHHTGELDDAVRFARRYVAHNPEDAEGYGVLSMLLLDNGELEEAQAVGQKALELKQDSLEGLVTMGSLALERQESAPAQEYFARAVERHPKSGRAWSGMGLTDMLAMDIERAIKDLTKAVQFMPGHIGTWHALGWCQIVTSDLDGATQSFEKSMEIDRNFGETHGGLAVIAAMRGQNERAEGLIKRALRLNPESFAGRFAKSLLLSQSGNAGEAQKMVREILESRMGMDGKTLQQSLVHVFKEREKISTTRSEDTKGKGVDQKAR